MPPHCDTLDGPIVKAAKKALKEKKVETVLPYVLKNAEQEVKRAYVKVVALRKRAGPTRALADRYFFETVVRLHRMGEGAPYTGLKPAGLDVGPVIPLAEQALHTGSPTRLLATLINSLKSEVKKRLAYALHLRKHSKGKVDDERKYVEAMLGFQVYSHKLYHSIKSNAHDAHGQHSHE